MCSAYKSLLELSWLLLLLLLLSAVLQAVRHLAPTCQHDHGTTRANWHCQQQLSGRS
jgi:hypothetical protein